MREICIIFYKKTTIFNINIQNLAQYVLNYQYPDLSKDY